MRAPKCGLEPPCGATTPYRQTLNTIQATLEAAGIIFIEGDDTVGPGVQLREPQKK